MNNKNKEIFIFDLLKKNIEEKQLSAIIEKKA